MGLWSRYILLIIWFSYLFVCGVLLFTRGFLLSRQSLSNNATCNGIEDCSNYRQISEENPSIKNKKLYLDCLDRDQIRLEPGSKFNYVCKNNNRRAIILLIDALKFDFAQYNLTIKDNERLSFQNRMPIFHELLDKFPDNARLFKFIANPPTTTLQRLKGLTTGSLPTFIDAGLNFGTPEINEDNILAQLRSMGKEIVLMGDDVWSNLFPKQSIREYVYPSFNIYDLDKVDSSVEKHLKRELFEKDWSLLVAHFLGVDHCGHAFGPNHKEMSRKLTEMNDVVRDVVDAIDDNTMLFVLGDHGMTSTGDHGGESEDEVNAALFFYSPMQLLPKEIAPIQSSIHQVDFVPTIAFALGTAIPFSNLGKMVLELLPIPYVRDNSSLDSFVPYAAEALAVNIEQIMLYINTYSRHTHLFSKEKIMSIASRFRDLRETLENVRDHKSFAAFRIKSIRFLNYVRESFEEIWVQFDSFLISRGLVLTFLLLTFTFILVEGLPFKDIVAVLEGNFHYYAYGIIAICSVGSIILQLCQYVEDAFLLAFVSSLTLSIFLMAVIVVQNWLSISLLGLRIYRNQDWSEILPRVIYIFSLLLFFSNSFVVEEGQVLLFLLASTVWLVVASITTTSESLFPPSKGRKDERSLFTRIVAQPRVRSFVFAIIFAILLRFSIHFWSCREEQKCYRGDPRKTSRGVMETLATLALLSLFTSAVRMWLRGCGNLVGFSPGVTLARYAPSVIVVCTGGYWVLQGLPRDTRARLLVPWQLHLLPWTVFALVGFAIIVLVSQPLFIYVVQKKTDCLSVYGRENIIPQLFHQVKEVMKKPDGKRKLQNESPVVYGLATSYSATIITLAEFFCLFVVLILGDFLASSAILLFTSAICLLFLLAYVRLETCPDKLYHIPWPIVITWGLLSSYFFYGTGHQPTIPNIHWYAAFVGTNGHFSSHAFPAFLIGANTFCSQVLMGILLPLLLIGPFTLFIMLPRWLQLSSDREKEAQYNRLRQGELLLYEEEHLLQYAAFKLTAKYILFHATRMFTCMLAAAFHCRHLMVWKIFAPRFIFEGLGFFVTLVSSILSYLLLARISAKIGRAISELNQ